MRARRKLVSSSHPGEKGTCQLSHKDRLAPRKATSRSSEIIGGPYSSRLRHLASSFHSPWLPSRGRLIANPRLKFGVSHRRINQLRISNRERMTILTIRPGLASRATSGSRRISLARYTRGPNPEPQFLTGTLAISEFESTARKQATKRNSNRYKTRFLCPPRRNGIFGSCPLRGVPRNSGLGDASRATVTGPPHA